MELGTAGSGMRVQMREPVMDGRIQCARFIRTVVNRRSRGGPPLWADDAAATAEADATPKAGGKPEAGRPAPGAHNDVKRQKHLPANDGRQQHRQACSV